MENIGGMINESSLFISVSVHVWDEKTLLWKAIVPPNSNSPSTWVTVITTMLPLFWFGMVLVTHIFTG